MRTCRAAHLRTSPPSAHTLRAFFSLGAPLRILFSAAISRHPAEIAHLEELSLLAARTLWQRTVCARRIFLLVNAPLCSHRTGLHA